MAGRLCDPCAERSRFGDGRICRACAAWLGEVQPDTVSAWIRRDRDRVAGGGASRLDVRYEGKRPMLMPAQVIELAYELHGRERARLQFLGSLQPDLEAVT